MIDYGIPASITLAQGILESGAGKSELAMKSNNHFGIKCHTDWAGQTVYYDDDAANECFRKYNQPQESFHDHSLFLTSRDRYADLFQLDRTDYKGWAKGLKKAGYATNPQYAELLINLIEDYQLYIYDKMDLADLHTLEKTDAIYTTGKTETTKKELSSEKAGVFYFNRIPTVIVREGDTPESIAKEHNIYLKRILSNNDIRVNTPLETGTHIYLQPKRKKGSVKYHVVKAGENMWSISRDEGVAMDRLYLYNLMNKGQEPAPGETLYLRKKRKDPIQLAAPASKIQTEKHTELQSKAQEQKLVMPDADEMEFENYTEQTLITEETSGEEIIDTPPPAAAPEKIMHTVQAKETLYAISKRYDVSIEDLQKWNALKNNNISIGQKLIVGYK